MRSELTPTPRSHPRWSRGPDYRGSVTISAGSGAGSSRGDPFLGLGRLGQIGVLVLGGTERANVVLVHVLASPHPRGQRGDEEHERGDGEGDSQAVDERPGDQVREELL